VKLIKIQFFFFNLDTYVQTNTENRNLKIKEIKTHHIANLIAIKEGAAQLTGIYDAVALGA
jgi:hypothetical protein